MQNLFARGAARRVEPKTVDKLTIEDLKMAQNKKTHILTLLLLLMASLAMAQGALAKGPNPAVNTYEGLTLAGPGLAIHGYDAVAFFSDGVAKLGSATHSSVHDGATYRFSSVENLKAFEKNPKRYAPQFGGFCAFGVSVGAKFDGDPNLWRIVDGKLYFNLNYDIQKNWLKDIDGNIKKAEKNWRKIKDAAPSSLK